MHDADIPWLAEKLEALTIALAEGRLPHAILVEGPGGVGKHILARLLTRRLLCTAGDRSRIECGHCQSCRLFEAANHPDFHPVGPEEDKATISVDQIRDLGAALALTSHMGSARVGIIVPADAMTHAAANSLLKTLEEPGPGTTLILVTSHPAALPATVRSRCQAVRVGLPTWDAACAWLGQEDTGRDWSALLRMAGGAPLKALALHKAGHERLGSELAADLIGVMRGREDPVEVADRWEKTGARLCLEWLHVQLVELARARALGEPPRDDLQKAAEAIHLDRLLRYAGQVLRARALTEKSVNKRMMLEGLLVPWAHRLGIDFTAVEASIA